MCSKHDFYTQLKYLFVLLPKRRVFNHIETFEEALAVEKMYSAHRDSNEFREELARKKLKRDHPVNMNLSNSGLIDVNYMVKKIDLEAGPHDDARSKLPMKATASNEKSQSSSQSSIYHKQCREEHLVKPASRGNRGIGK